MKRYLAPLLALVVVLVYLNGAWGEFVFDDTKLIGENPSIRSWKNALEAFNIFSDRWEHEQVRPNYRPVRFLSYTVDWHLTRLLFPSAVAAVEKRQGSSPEEEHAEVQAFPTVVFHLHNVLLHALNAVLVFVLLRGLTGSIPGAFFLALLWALHPVQVESVTYLSGRRDVLFSTFYLAALLCATGAPLTFGRLSAVCLLYAASLLTKEMAVTFPAVFLCVEFLRAGRLRKGQILRTAPLWILTCLYIAFKLLVKNPGGGAPPWGGTLTAALLTEARALFRYLWLCLFPVWLSVDWSYAAIVPSRGLFDPWTTAPCVAGALLVGLVGLWRFLRRRSLDGLGICLFFLTLSPVMQMVPHPERFAEHFLYLPLLGVCLGLWPLFRAVGATRSGPVAACALLVLLAGRTMRRNRDWKDGLTLWQQAVAVNPDCARAHYALGIELKNHKAYKEAAQHFSRVFAILSTKKVLTALQQGQLLHARAHRAEVLAAWGDRLKEKLVTYAPGDPGRGALLRKVRALYREAAQDYETLLRMRDVDGTPICESPRHALVHKNLAGVYFRLQEYEKARDHFRKILLLLPGSDHAHDARFYLGMIEIARGRITAGKTQILLAAQATHAPGAAFAYKAALGNLLFKLGLWEDALGVFDQILPQAQGEDRRSIQYARAKIFDRLGRRDEAKWLLAGLAEEDPSFLEAHVSLVDMEVKEGKWREAARRVEELEQRWGQLPLLEAYKRQIVIQQALSEKKPASRSLDSQKLLRVGRENLSQGNLSEAVGAFKEAYLRAQEEGRKERALVALRYLGRALREGKNYQEAYSVLRRALRAAPSDTRFLKDLGRLLATERKDFQEALATYRKLFEVAGDSSTKIEAAVALGDLFFGEGAKERALLWYGKAEGLGTVPAELTYRCGRIYEELGKTAEAEKAYRSVLTSAHASEEVREAARKHLAALSSGRQKAPSGGDREGGTGNRS